MTRYSRRRPRQCDDDIMFDPPLIPHLEVSDHEPSFTGLLDANGDEIWRDPNPIGFIWYEFDEVEDEE